MREYNMYIMDDPHERISENFLAGEFRPRHNPMEVWFIARQLVSKLEGVRKSCCSIAGEDVPLVINSAFRDRTDFERLRRSGYNPAPKGRHMMALAVDVAIPEGMPGRKFAAIMYYHGIRRIGYGTTFLHVDIDAANYTEWRYTSGATLPGEAALIEEVCLLKKEYNL